ncbi:MAG: tRNA (N6-isopentenyl adenosine(37)-C2)-methylthiotransferase MiaB [Spirochaetes bacterium]|nr:MAG: tRNA (N6-isopentenyl adenosine(37)-C2)-methylthiotransferase MiaB [Spirochaetota bacterium]
MNKKYWIETYGCQMNFAESKALDYDFDSRGWEKADSPEEADLVLLNTCSVRQTAENRIWGRIGFYKHLKEEKDFVLGITGCMAERLKKEIKAKAPAVDMVIGNFNKDILLSYLENHDRNFWNDDLVEDREYAFRDVHVGENDFKALVPIMHGCNNFCSYCIVPYVRGREVSRSPESVLKELYTLEEKGIKEVTFLGQNVNSYNYIYADGRKVSFTGLLRIVLENIKGIQWFRFISSHPKDVPEDLIQIIADEERVCSHIHLAVQHGSDSVLKRMNRGYTRSGFLKLVDFMKTRIADLSLTTDLLIGFPGESPEDLALTIDLMEEVGFDDAFTYYYNPREGTKAFSFKDALPEEVKRKRLAEVIDVQRKISRNIKRKRVGKVEQVLVEGVSRNNSNELLGRTSRNEMVVFPAKKDFIGEFAEVLLKELQGNTYRGVLV